MNSAARALGLLGVRRSFYPARSWGGRARLRRRREYHRFQRQPSQNKSRRSAAWTFKAECTLTGGQLAFQFSPSISLLSGQTVCRCCASQRCMRYLPPDEMAAPSSLRGLAGERLHVLHRKSGINGRELRITVCSSCHARLHRLAAIRIWIRAAGWVFGKSQHPGVAGQLHFPVGRLRGSDLRESSAPDEDIYQW
jgi:hypothetical protein